MKKIVYLFLGFGIIIFILHTYQKRDYNKKLNMTEYRKFGVYSIDYILEYYYNENKNYPASKIELRKFLFELLEDDSLTNSKYFLEDYFSVNEDEIKYIPIFDHHKIEVGYIILSAGTDGKFNIKEEDSLFYDDIPIAKSNIYNDLLDYKNRDLIQISEIDLPYNCFDKFFGKKDYLISFVINE